MITIKAFVIPTNLVKDWDPDRAPKKKMTMMIFSMKILITGTYLMTVTNSKCEN